MFFCSVCLPPFVRHCQLARHIGRNVCEYEHVRRRTLSSAVHGRPRVHFCIAPTPFEAGCPKLGKYRDIQTRWKAGRKNRQQCPEKVEWQSFPRSDTTAWKLNVGQASAKHALIRNSNVCVCRPISYFVMHIQTMHPRAHRATYILARGLMNAENPVGPLGRVQAFSFVAFKVQVKYFVLAGGGNQSSPLRRQIALSEPISFGSASKLPRWIQSAQLCTHPFTFHGSVSGYISGGRCDHRPCTRTMTTSFGLRRSW